MRHFERLVPLYNLKDVKNTQEGVVLLVTLHISWWWGGGGGAESQKTPSPPVHYGQWKHGWWKLFLKKPINGAFSTINLNRTINLLICRGWVSYCAIIGGIQYLVQDELFPLFRSSRSQMFVKIGALKNFAIFTGKHLCRTSRIRNLGTRFFVYLITCLRTRSCASHFVHLKQSFLHTCTLTCTTPCTYNRDRNILEQKIN